MLAARVHEGGELRVEQAPDPVPRPGEVVVELTRAGLNRRDLLVSGGVYPFPLPLIPGSDGVGIAPRHGRGGRDPPRACTGATARTPSGPGFEVLGGPDRRHVRGARRRAGRERLSAARRLERRGVRRLPARRADRLPGALLACRAPGGRDGARARRGQRRVDVGGAARGSGRGPGARHLVVGREDRALGRARRRGGRQLRDDGGLARCREGAGAGRRGRRLRRRDLAAVARMRAPGRAGRRLRRDAAARRSSCRCARSTSASCRCSGR